MARVPAKLAVKFTAQSLRDLGDIWDWNSVQRGQRHADDYVNFLLNETRKLTNAKRPGKEVATNPDYKYLTINHRTRGYGHVAIFWIEDRTIHIFRYFHTAQDWEKKLIERFS